MKFQVIIFIFLLSVPALFSYEAILIDFNNLENTTIDFSEMAGQDVWTKEQRDAMRLDLNPKNWRAKVCPSSWVKLARERTKVIPVTNSLNFPNETVLGIRIFFPERYANSYAEILPPFEIPSFYDDKEEPDGMGGMFLHKGVVRNVGILRKLSVKILGNNFKYVFYVRIEDGRGQVRDVFIGFLDYVGWKTKSWVNPNIDWELQLREAKKGSGPYYPDELPTIKLVNFLIHRAEPQITGNFVTMIKEVSIEYDEAFLEVGKAEYLQESIFGIHKEQLVERANVIMRNVDKRVYLEWVEKAKQHKEEDKE